MYKKLNLVLIIVMSLIIPAAALAQEMTPGVTVEDQEIVDGAVTISMVVSSGPGWLVIHADDGGSPGPVLGFSPVVEGENADIAVEVDPEQATEILYAMLHTDAGTVGTYEFPGDDGPVMVDGAVVTPSFNVISAMMEEGEAMDDSAAMEEGAAEEGEAMEETEAMTDESATEDSAMMAEGEMMAAVACQTDYVVQADDWLSKIADKFYADVLSFPAIVEATNSHSAMMADKSMAEDGAMAEDDAMAEGDEMMADSKLVVQGADGTMMDVTMDAEGMMMVAGTDGEMMEVTMGEDGSLMMADGTMMDGKLMMTDAEGQMMDVMMSDGKMMVAGADGEMTEVMMEDKMTADETMAEGDAMAEDAMMTGYASIDNPDVIEVGWTLCIPSAEDADKLLSGEGAMMEGTTP